MTAVQPGLLMFDVGAPSTRAWSSEKVEELCRARRRPVEWGSTNEFHPTQMLPADILT